MPLEPLSESPQFLSGRFGKFLSGKRIWVPTWAIFIRTLDMAFFSPTRPPVWHPLSSIFFLLLGFGNPNHVLISFIRDITTVLLALSESGK